MGIGNVDWVVRYLERKGKTSDSISWIKKSMFGFTLDEVEENVIISVLLRIMSADKKTSPKTFWFWH